MGPHRTSWLSSQGAFGSQEIYPRHCNESRWTSQNDLKTQVIASISHNAQALPKLHRDQIDENDRPEPFIF